MPSLRATLRIPGRKIAFVQDPTAGFTDEARGIFGYVVVVDGVPLPNLILANHLVDTDSRTLDLATQAAVARVVAAILDRVR